MGSGSAFVRDIGGRWGEVLDTDTAVRCHMLMLVCQALVLSLATPMAGYCFLLCAPSLSMPSHPVIFPAISSTFPYPDVAGSRFALACFMASMPADLSCSPEEVQA